MGFKTVCLRCRKAFNLSSDIEERKKQSLKCPECGEPAVQLSHRFRPPKKADDKKWEVVRFLCANGFRYEHIYVNSVLYGKYPETMQEAKEFADKFKSR